MNSNKSEITDCLNHNDGVEVSNGIGICISKVMVEKKIICFLRIDVERP